jgi:hypothetical protein
LYAPSRFYKKNYECISYVCYLSRPSHPPLFDDNNNGCGGEMVDNKTTLIFLLDALYAEGYNLWSSSLCIFSRYFS